MNPTKKLRIIHNLETISEQEREQYKRSVSEYYGLDPDLNAFDYLWIPDEVTGLKKLVLYARRGTTDLLRDKNQISVLDMTQHDGVGYVSFKALGTDPSGRKEIAVGAHSIDGLKGERLAAAVSTAETRAGRRLTLKFLGLGILDASEVNMDVVLDTSKASEAQLLGSPMVIPPISLPKAISTVAETPYKPETDEEFKARQEKLHADAQAHLAAAQQPKSVALVEGNQNELPAAPAVPKVRKPRKKKNTVDISSPGQTPVLVIPDPASVAISAAITKAIFDPNPPFVPVQVDSAVPTQVNHAPSVEELAKQSLALAAQPVALTAQPVALTAQPAAAPLDFPGKPTKEQADEYRAKVREYTNTVLIAGNMMPSEGIGGPSAKMKMFAERMSNKATALMTVSDWDEFFAFLDRFNATNGPKNLVKYINDVIGAK